MSAEGENFAPEIAEAKFFDRSPERSSKSLIHDKTESSSLRQSSASSSSSVNVSGSSDIGDGSVELLADQKSLENEYVNISQQDINTTPGKREAEVTGAILETDAPASVSRPRLNINKAAKIDNSHATRNSGNERCT
jgi:hypothetical protein